MDESADGLTWHSRLVRPKCRLRLKCKNSRRASRSMSKAPACSAVAFYATKLKHVAWLAMRVDRRPRLLRRSGMPRAARGQEDTCKKFVTF